MFVLRRVVITVLFIILTFFALGTLKQFLDPNEHKSDEEREDRLWISTSKSWLDRNACRYIGLCGLAHYHSDPAWAPKRIKAKSRTQPLQDIQKDAEYEGWGEAPVGGGKLKPEDFNGDERVLKEVPQFVLDHAPLIHLYSGEQFWPSDMGAHLTHTIPSLNHTKLNTTRSQHTLHNLHELNEGYRGRFLYMKSKEDVEDRPKWLGSAYNKPMPFEDDEDEEEVETYKEFVDMDTNSEDMVDWYDPFGEKQKTADPLSPSHGTKPHRPNRKARRQAEKPLIMKPAPSGRSPAPAILIMVDKGHGILDAFWFYFYSYNLGTTVLSMRFGNHVGDWEHSLIRFHNGQPKAIFFSAHSGGTAFSYNSVEKGKGKGREGRPVLYSAVGSHAMYAMPGTHPYVLPFGLLADVTDKGPLWDPALNYLAYHYNTSITHNVDAKSLLPGLSTNPNPEHESDINPLTDEETPISTRKEHISPYPSRTHANDILNPSSKDMHDTFIPAACNPSAPTSWFWYKGHWGDKFYELGDWRQWRFVGQYHYVNGPLGPRFKNLGRSKVCQSGRNCRILDSIKEGRSWLRR